MLSVTAAFLVQKGSKGLPVTTSFL